MNPPPEKLRIWTFGRSALIYLYVAAFLVYSQTWAFHFDEGYHLLTAQLILAGKKPYIDFCFPQSPLNAYWNAFWMSVFGQTWRVAHVVAALLTIGAVLLTADFAARRFPVPDWRAAGALTAASLIGLNSLVFEYGSLAQPYAICLFTLVVAFRITVRAVDRSGFLLPASAGFFAGAAAASSLLTAAAAPVFLIWLLRNNRIGSRWLKLTAYGIGAAIPFAPVLWLFSRGARATWFNLVQYHASYRALYWPETTRHDLEILTSWINSGQGLLLGLLALFGWLYVSRRSDWHQDVKSEFYLCAWLSAALCVEVGSAHPTFSQYFLLIVPFLAISAVAGLYAVASRVFEPAQQWWPPLLVVALLVLGLGRSLYDTRDDDKWSSFGRVAEKIDQVTPRNAPVFANEPVYVLTRRVPPPGLELEYTHKVILPPAERALLHLLTEDEIKQQLQAGAFVTAYGCDKDENADHALPTLYKQHVDLDGCTVFWDLKSPRTPAH